MNIKVLFEPKAVISVVVKLTEIEFFTPTCVEILDELKAQFEELKCKTNRATDCELIVTDFFHLGKPEEILKKIIPVLEKENYRVEIRNLQIYNLQIKNFSKLTDSTVFGALTPILREEGFEVLGLWY